MPRNKGRELRDLNLSPQIYLDSRFSSFPCSVHYFLCVWCLILTACLCVCYFASGLKLFTPTERLFTFPFERQCVLGLASCPLVSCLTALSGYVNTCFWSGIHSSILWGTTAKIWERRKWKKREQCVSGWKRSEGNRVGQRKEVMIACPFHILLATRCFLQKRRDRESERRKKHRQRRQWILREAA